MLRVLLYENTGGVESAFRVVFVRSCVLFMLFMLFLLFLLFLLFMQ